MVKALSLSDGRTTLVDDEDYEAVASYRWFGGGSRGRYTARIEHRLDGKPKTVYLHRILMNPGSYMVDHINGNTLDNQRANLRLATRQENTQHKLGVHGASQTGFRNVYWYERQHRYRVRLTINNKGVSCGYYKTLAEAAEVARRMRAQLYVYIPKEQGT